MQTEEIVEVKTAIAVTEDALRLLCDRVERMAAEAQPDRLGNRSPVRYRGKLVDKSKIAFDSSDELLAYQNRNSRRLTELDITWSRALSEEGLTIWMGHIIILRASAKGDVSYTSQARQYLEDFAEAARAPWAWMWWRTGDILFGAVMAMLVGFYVLLAIYGSNEAGTGGTTPSQKSYGYGGLLVFAVVAIIATLAYLRSWIFPRTLFAIGQGKSRFETLRRWHWLPVGALAGLIVKVAWDFLSR